MARSMSGEGSVYYLQSRASWHYSYHDIDGRRKSRKAQPNTEAGARACLRRALRERDEGKTVAGKATLAGLMERWIEAKVVAGCRSRTVEAYRDRMRLHVLPSLGAIKLERLSASAIEGLYARLLREGASSTTVRSIHSTLTNILRYARRHRYVPEIVTEYVTPPRKQRYRARILTPEELRQIISGTRDHQHGPLWVFMAGSGCRFGEAAGLTWPCVDLGNGAATIRQQVTRERKAGEPIRYVLAPVKTEATIRTVPLPAFAVEALRAQQARMQSLEDGWRSLGGKGRWNPLELVFPSRVGSPLRENHVLVAWHRALRELGIKTTGEDRLRMHDLRHTKATLMREAGIDTTTISKSLGHANLSITADTYIGHTPTALREAADTFGRMVEE